jgi:hypothetical protein
MILVHRIRVIFSFGSHAYFVYFHLFYLLHLKMTTFVAMFHGHWTTQCATRAFGAKEEKH